MAFEFNFVSSKWVYTFSIQFNEPTEVRDLDGQFCIGYIVLIYFENTIINTILLVLAFLQAATHSTKKI